MDSDDAESSSSVESIDIDTLESQLKSLMLRSKYFYIGELKFKFNPEDKIF